jgi:hypothetical protein
MSPNPVPLRNVLPNDKMVNANLGPIKMTHPENWPVTLPEQKGQFVTIAPSEGVTKTGVGYGVLLNGVGPQGQQSGIDDMTVALIKQIQQTNEMEQLGKPEAIAVGGKEGRSTFLRSPSPFPDANGQVQPERDWLVTVPQSDGSMIYLIFIAPQADFSQLQPTYDAMVKSVQFR